MYHYFSVHPQVLVPAAIKETNYMAFYEGMPPLAGPGDKYALAGKSITRFADYQTLYRQRRDELVAADDSPAYLYCPQAAEKIAELCPQAKIIIILRSPVRMRILDVLDDASRFAARSPAARFGRPSNKAPRTWQPVGNGPGIINKARCLPIRSLATKSYSRPNSFSSAAIANSKKIQPRTIAI